MAATIDVTGDEIDAVVDMVDHEQDRLRRIVDAQATADAAALFDETTDRTPADSEVAELVAAYRRLEKIRDHATEDAGLPVYEAWNTYIADAFERAADDHDGQRAAALDDLADRYRAAGDLPE